MCKRRRILDMLQETGVGRSYIRFPRKPHKCLCNKAGIPLWYHLNTHAPSAVSEAYTTYLNNKFNRVALHEIGQIKTTVDWLRSRLRSITTMVGQGTVHKLMWDKSNAFCFPQHNTTWLWQNRLPPLAGHIWRLRTLQKELRRVMQTQIRALATSIYSPRNSPTPCTHPSTLPVHRPCGLRTNCVPVLLFWRAPWDPATCAPALPSFSISLGSKYIIYIIYIEGYYIKTSQKNLSPKPFLKTLPKAQLAQGIEYFDSFKEEASSFLMGYSFTSGNVDCQVNHRIEFSLVLFGKRKEIHRPTLTNLCNNLIKTNPWRNLDNDNSGKSMQQFW